MSYPIWLDNARKFDGVHANGGHPSNPTIIGWAKYLASNGYQKAVGWYNSDTISWCGLFMGYIMKSSGYSIVDYPLFARNWSTYGTPLKEPTPGAIMVFARGAGLGHVCFYVSEDANHYHVFGGNQRNHIACLNTRRKAGLLAIRWPPGQGAPTTGPETRIIDDSPAPPIQNPTVDPTREFGERISSHGQFKGTVISIKKYDSSPQGYHWVGPEPATPTPPTAPGGFATARLGDPCTHGATIVTACQSRFVGDHLVARVGDIVDCPLHGRNPIIGPIENVLTENNSTARQLSYAQCGAQITPNANGGVYNDT